MSGVHTSTAKGLGSVPGGRTKISQVGQHGQGVGEVGGGNTCSLNSMQVITEKSGIKMGV